MTIEFDVVEELQSTYSDYHKDLYGFRPRSMSDEQWNSEEWLRAEIKYLDEVAPSIYAEEAKQEQAAIDAVEATIADIINVGAGDRATAVEWLAHANEVDGDMDYLCFLLGVPYGYFKKAA